jgi:hypothetical protein
MDSKLFGDFTPIFTDKNPTQKNMITIIAKRKKDGADCPDVIHSLSPAEALTFLTEVELGFGAQVITLTPTEIVTEVGVCGCVDTSVFSGSAEGMEMLVKTAVLFAHVQQNTELLAQAAAQAADILGAGGIPLILNFGAGLFVGQGQISLAVMLALGITELDDVKAGAGTKTQDLLAAFDLMTEEGCTFKQALGF